MYEIEVFFSSMSLLRKWEKTKQNKIKNRKLRTVATFISIKGNTRNQMVVNLDDRLTFSN